MESNLIVMYVSHLLQLITINRRLLKCTMVRLALTLLALMRQPKMRILVFKEKADYCFNEHFQWMFHMTLFSSGTGRHLPGKWLCKLHDGKSKLPGFQPAALSVSRNSHNMKEYHHLLPWHFPQGCIDHGKVMVVRLWKNTLIQTTCIF